MEETLLYKTLFEMYDDNKVARIREHLAMANVSNGSVPCLLVGILGDSVKDAGIESHEMVLFKISPTDTVLHMLHFSRFSPRPAYTGGK